MSATAKLLIENFRALKQKVQSVKVWDYPAKDDVVRRAVLYARRAFSPNTYFIEQIEKVRFEGIAFAILGGPPGPSSSDVREWDKGKRDLNNIIDLIIEELELESRTREEEKSGNSKLKSTLERLRATGESERSDTKSSDRQSKRIFVVHGHDDSMKDNVARIISKLRLEPIILHEQANKGRTIIEKFEDEASDVGFAVVLLSPDDEGRRRGDEKLRPRARQNVVLELGFFYGKLGRGKVFALYRDMDEFELPSDISGVIYVPYDKEGAWKMDFYRELRDSGYDVNADDII